ncbi:MAG: 1,4-dihydroxy-6-naphthoate synthase [Desulfovibrionaceae bacterium]|nr:1,4-dihydroxy-6-naphthoate synthase [Desulfovibrionaceae bacterium]
MKKTLPLYISPCPNDTFITYAMNTGILSMPCEFDVHFADVEELNQSLVKRPPCVSKISVAALAYCKEEYTILETGAAMGLGCGPLVVAKEKIENISCASIATPGIYTTAHALLSLYGEFQGRRIPMLFSDIPNALQEGSVDMGVLIHETRFEYERYGLHLITDLGIFWEETYAMPLPLGIFVIHNSLLEYKETVEEVMRASIEYAYKQYDNALTYCANYAQELDTHTLESHIAMFVNSYTLDMGEQGRCAIKMLIDALQCE